jgi:flagellar hook-associated protein 2
MSTTAVSSSSSATPATTASSTSSTSSNSTTQTAASLQQANQASAQKIISSLGAGSGVDTAALAQNLVDAEMAPQQNEINSKISKNDSKISGLSGVMYIMQAFSDSLTALKDKNNFNVLTANNTNTAAFGVTADNTAIPGAHSVNVTSIAQAQESLSNGFADSGTSINSGNAFNLTIQGSNPGISVGTSSTDTTTSSMATLSNVTFGTNASTTDFKSFTLTVGGVTKILTPRPAAATLNDLATDLQTQLQGIEGTTDLTVSNTGGKLMINSASGRIITNVALSKDAVITVGTPSGVNLGQTQTATLAGVSFGTNPTLNDFGNMTVTVGGVTKTITPTLISTSITDLANSIQTQLNTAYGGSDIHVSVVTDSVGTNLQISSDTQPISYAKLNTGSSNPAGASGGIFNNGTVSGVNFSNTSDLQSFSVSVDGKPLTISPSPSTATLDALATDLQTQLNAQDKANNGGSGSDLVVKNNNGVLSITSTSGKSITNPVFSEFPDTPDGIVSAINSRKLGIQAQVINSGSTDPSVPPYQIMLTGAIGASNAFSISSPVTGLTFGKNIQDATDAKLSVDGVAYTRHTNAVSDIVKGVTFNLNSPTGTAASVNLTRDTSSLVTNINSMVSAYNDAMNVLNAVSDPKSTLATYGATLVGDSTVRMLKQKMRDMMLGTSSTPGTGVGALWQMGITVDDKGVMSVSDTTMLNSALSNNFDDVVKTFTGNQNKLTPLSTTPGGLAGDAVKQLTSLLSTTGPIATKSATATTQNSKYQDDLTALQTRMDALLKRYQTEFAAMNSFVGSVNSQKTSLKASFDGMMAMYTNK